MNGLTVKQEEFLQVVKSGDEAGVRQRLSCGDRDLLCIIGMACGIALKIDHKIFDLLADEKSPYEILQIYHGAKPQRFQKEISEPLACSFS